MATQAAVVPHFTYHEWPGQQPPPLQYRSRPISWQPALTRSSSSQPGYSSSVANYANSQPTAPLPFVHDPVNNDYFCYDPDTTGFVYLKTGRIFYDAVKKQHYHPDAPQQLTFAREYPKHRVYQNGEVMFFDARQQDWYSYDTKKRRVVWRDGRYWPFPPKFEAPAMVTAMPKSKSSASKKSHRTKTLKSPKPKYRALPVSVVGEPMTFDDSFQDPVAKPLILTEPEENGYEEIRVVEVKQDNALASLSGDSGGKKEKRSRHRNRAQDDCAPEVFVVPEDTEEIYEVTPAIDARGKRMHRKHKAGIYDLQDLVDRSVGRKRTSWV